jgi:hypothetical protein
MVDFGSFRNAFFENDNLQKQILSVMNAAMRNSSDLGDGIVDGIVTLAKNNGYAITSDEVYEYFDLLSRGEDLTNFELNIIKSVREGSI